VREFFDLRPYGLTKQLDLLHPIYRPTSSYGHFGRNSETINYNGHDHVSFTWEKTDKAAALRDAAGLK